MIDRDSTSPKSHVVHVKVLDVEKRYRPGPKHYVYVVQVTWSNPANTFIIYRRYAQFFDLQCKLLDRFAEAPSPANNYKSQSRQLPFLPGKIFLGRSQIRQIALERKQALNIYCQTLISLPEHISRSRPVLEFFQPLPTDIQHSAASASNEKKPVTKESIIISGPSKLPTYRCTNDFNAIEKTEMSLKRNTLVQVVHKHLNGWWFVQNGDRTGFVPGAFLEPIDEQSDASQVADFSRSANETYIVNKTYQATNREEISLDQGSFVTVLEKSFTGWWIVTFNDRTGQFPAVYLTSCKGRVVPENVTSSTRLSSSPHRISPLFSQEAPPAASSTTFIRRLSSLSNYERNDNDDHPTQAASELFYVHTDYIDHVGDCVSLQRGDRVEIHDQHSSGWWLGRRLQDDYVLTWIPSAFLQKEPLSDTDIETIDSVSLHPAQYTNLPIDEPQPASTNSIYQNMGHRISTEAIYPEETQRQPGILPTLTMKHSSLPSIESDTDTARVSVRDLVKRFNRQE